MTEAQKAVDTADEKFDEARQDWKPLDNERQAYLDFTRGLEMHIARVEIALHCKADVDCYGKALSAKPEEITGRLGKYIKTFDTWTESDKKAVVLSGPYAETQEQLGGFVIIDVTDLDRAIEWAEKCPLARTGSIEIRPIWSAAS